MIDNSMNFEQEVQEIVLEYFKNVDDKTIFEVIDSFVYFTPITNRKSKTSKIIEKFLEDNGLTNAYLNYVNDMTNKTKFFNKSSMSEADLIEKVRTAMLNLAYNRFRNLVTKRDTNFNFLKKTVLEVFECLNNNEQYIYGKEEDTNLIAKVESMKS